MAVGQVLAVGAGVVAVVIGVWLLRSAAGASDKPAEARTPLFSISGSPGLLLTLAGLFLVVFPFTPWWPNGDSTDSQAEVGPEGPASVEDLPLEAEAGTIAAPMEVGRDDGASGGAYVSTTVKDEGSLTLEFDVAGGTYEFWGRVAAPDGAANANSVYVSLDGEDADIWDFGEEETDSLPSDWRWERISLRCGGTFDFHKCDPWTRPLSGGPHTLVLRGREIDSRVDALVVTNDPEYRR